MEINDVCPLCSKPVDYKKELKYARLHPVYDWLLVTPEGRVFSTKSQHWKKANKQANGYYTTYVLRKNATIHCLVLEAFSGLKPHPKMQCAHLDGNKANNNIKNLKWVTAKENAGHRSQHGTTPMGMSHFNRKTTTPEIVRYIRNNYNSPGRGHNKHSVNKSNIAELANKFNISKGLVYKIAIGETWKQIK